MIQQQQSMPDMSCLSLEKKEAPDSSRQRRQQTETDGDMVFSTADTSVQGTQRDPHQNLHMGSQSSMGGLEEMKSAGPGNLTRRDQLNEQNLMHPAEYQPPELGRPSLSESMGASSKNFSPQFDKRSSRTQKSGRPLGCDEENILDDEEESEGQPAVNTFLGGRRANPHFQGGEGVGRCQQKVDGIF